MANKSLPAGVPVLSMFVPKAMEIAASVLMEFHGVPPFETFFKGS